MALQTIRSASHIYPACTTILTGTVVYVNCFIFWQPCDYVVFASRQYRAYKQIQLRLRSRANHIGPVSVRNNTLVSLQIVCCSSTPTVGLSEQEGWLSPTKRASAAKIN